MVTDKDIFDYIVENYGVAGGVNKIATNLEVVIKGQNVKLGNYLSNFRRTYRKYQGQKDIKPNKKVQEKIKMYDSIGIEWNPQESLWMKKYEACKKYKELYGTLNIGADVVVELNGERVEIGAFIANQRGLYNKYRSGTKKPVKDENLIRHFAMLEEIGVIFNVDEAEWLRKYNLLKEWKEKYGSLEDIDINTVVQVGEEEVALGTFANRQRMMLKNYLKEGQKDEKIEKKIRMLEEIGFIFNPLEYNFKKMFDLALEYKKQYGTINVPVDYTVTVKGKTYNVGGFISKQRTAYKKHKKDNFQNCPENIKKHFQLLEQEGLVFEPNKEKWLKNYHYLKAYYEKYQTLEIPVDFSMEIEQEEIKVGRILHDQRKFFNKYKDLILEGKADVEIMHKYYLLKEIGFEFSKSAPKIVIDLGEGVREYTKKDICRHYGISEVVFRANLERFKGNVEKAINISLLGKEFKNEKLGKKKKAYTIKNMLDEFDIDLKTLQAFLNRTFKPTKTSKAIMYSENESLRKYCIDNGYNYDVVFQALRLKENKLIDDNLNEAINRVITQYNKSGQQKPGVWIYSKYGDEVLLKHFLGALKLDSKEILREMTKYALTLEEAIENDVFSIISNRKYYYLEGIYHKIIEEYNKINTDKTINSEQAQDLIVNYIEKIVAKYQLDYKEYNILLQCFIKYTSSLNNYHIFDVGFEKDRAEKIRKIEKYVLDEDEIEEAFFVPLRFDSKVMLGRNSELYKRRVLLKNLTVGWDMLSREEQEEKIEKYKITKEEEYYITRTREKINDIKDTVRKNKI